MRSKPIIGAIVAASALLLAVSASAGDLETCRQIESALARLDCYDRIPSAAPAKRSTDASGDMSALRVSLRGGEYVPANARSGRYRDRYNLDFEYSNGFRKDIRAFTGVVVFMDIFEREFLRVNLTHDDPIRAGRTDRDKDKSLDINEFIAKHQQLATTDFKDLRVRFEPASIMFTDGTKLGSAQ